MSPDCEYEEIAPDAPETAHQGILANFAGAILRGEELLSPGADGLNELTISNAAYLSAWTGNRPVSLPMTRRPLTGCWTSGPPSRCTSTAPPPTTRTASTAAAGR